MGIGRRSHPGPRGSSGAGAVALGAAVRAAAASLVMVLAMTLTVGTGSAGATPPWKEAAVPAPVATSTTPGATVKDVDCPAAGLCVAVGTLSVADTSTTATATGPATATAAPARATAAPARATATTATATGTATNTASATSSTVSTLSDSTPQTLASGWESTRSRPLVEVSSNGSWTSVSAPLPANAVAGAAEDAGLTAVSCSTTSFCVASGFYLTAAGDQEGLLEVEAAGAWTASEATAPVNWTATSGHSYLEDVSCHVSGSCVAVGWYRSTTGTRPLTDVLSTGTWSALGVPPVPGSATGTGYLVSVSCTVSTCEAVGWVRDAAGGTVPLVARISGSVITASLAAMPAGALAASADNHLVAVSCGSPATCAAVGEFTNAEGTTTALADNFSAGAWTASDVPLPANVRPTTAGPQAELDAVDCPSPVLCIATGDYETVTVDFPGLIATESNGTWSSTPASSAADAASEGTAVSTLFAVSCPATGACTVSGSYQAETGAELPLVEQGLTGAWSAAAVPEPPTAASGSSRSATLVTVSCAQAACTAAGWFQAATGADLGLLETQPN